MPVIIEIPGKCIPKQRPRCGKGYRFYTPKETRNYELEVAWAGKIAMKGKKPFTGYLKATIEVYCQMPRSWPPAYQAEALAGKRYPTSGDLDNCCKSIFDGLNGIVYLDDNKVTRIEATKKYSYQPKAVVTIEEIAPSHSLRLPTLVF